jgi:H2-forming N5,N10-methylenetetrahydromethanopterin dehydrogenase-like enzyme
MKNKQTKGIEQHNAIVIGSISLESSNLSIDELINRALSIIEDATFKDYLTTIKLSGLTGSASYTG